MTDTPVLPPRRNDMAHKGLVLALTVIVAASPVSANSGDLTHKTVAPPGGPQTKYCMYIEAVTGSRLEEVKCWTRQEWAEREVDVDEEWAEEGVRTIG
jgi:hypothetical protein